jgi:hypothetical protein
VLHTLPGIAAAAIAELVRGRIAGIDPAQVGAFEDLEGRPVMVEGRPIGQGRVLDFSNNTRFGDGPATAPLVHVVADRGHDAACPVAVTVGCLNAAEVAREALLHGVQFRLTKHGDTGEMPEIARGAVGILEGQRTTNTFTTIHHYIAPIAGW